MENNLKSIIKSDMGGQNFDWTKIIHFQWTANIVVCSIPLLYHASNLKLEKNKQPKTQIQTHEASKLFWVKCEQHFGQFRRLLAPFEGSQFEWAKNFLEDLQSLVVVLSGIK